MCVCVCFSNSKCVFVRVGGWGAVVVVKDTCGGTSEASLTSKDVAADGKKSPLCDALPEAVERVGRNYPRRHLNTLTGYPTRCSNNWTEKCVI